MLKNFSVPNKDTWAEAMAFLRFLKEFTNK
jgi:hypothetical protein